MVFLLFLLYSTCSMSFGLHFLHYVFPGMYVTERHIIYLAFYRRVTDHFSKNFFFLQTKLRLHNEYMERGWFLCIKKSIVFTVKITFTWSEFFFFLFGFTSKEKVYFENNIFGIS